MAAVLGRYELLRPIARGGMAEVYLARRRSAGGVYKRLVVKRIRRERAADPRFVDLFIREARVSMALSHRNIVPVFDFGRAGDELFLVMEYVDGPDLASALSKNASVDPLVAAYVALEACDALGHAHQMESEQASQVVHRDVTPRNILLSFAGEVKLVDFGVAAALEDASTRGRVRGTPAYMAPEQAEGESVDGRADLFSLGLVLWEMLAGRRAYDSSDRDGQIEQAKAAVVPALSDDTPAALREIVDGLTRTDRDDRFETARDVHAALDELIVSARSQSENRLAPSRRLSSWLAELYPNKRVEGPDGDVDFPSGSVLTFLDHGEDVLREGDAATVRSMAETMAEPETDVESEADEGVDSAADSVDTTATVARPRTRSTWLWVAAAGVGAAIVAFVATRGEPAEPSEPRVAVSSHDATPQGFSPDAMTAAPPVDATVSAALDATVATAKPDAAPAAAKPDAARKTHPIKRTPPPAAKPGKVRIGSRPWAIVTVKGHSARCAETPCTLELPAGRYVLRLHNPVAGVTKTMSVVIEAGKTATVKAELR